MSYIEVMNLKTKLQTQGHGFKTHDLLTQRDLSNLKYLHYSLQSHALSICSVDREKEDINVWYSKLSSLHITLQNLFTKYMVGQRVSS